MMGVMAIALAVLGSIRKAPEVSTNFVGSALSGTVSIVFGLFGAIIAFIGLGFWVPALNPTIE